MISVDQKRLLHQYARIAGLADEEYRSLLLAHARCASCTDPHFGQDAFDRCMAALEEEIECRSLIGSIPDPVSAGSIRDLSRWRCRRVRGGATTRQRWMIAQLRLRLDVSVSEAYLLAWVEKATGRRPLSLDRLTKAEASALIDALRDHVAHV